MGRQLKVGGVDGTDEVARSSVPGSGAAEGLCLQLAWDALRAGTVPVGAVLIDGDADGTVVATGRSRMYDREAPPGQLANSLLAHAEINALVGLTPERRYEHLRLISSLEPCPLCMGAVAMSTIGRLRFFGADPYGGASGLLGSTAHTARVPLVVDGPDPGLIGELSAALHVAFYLRRKPNGEVVRVHRERGPRVYGLAVALVEGGLWDLVSGEPSWAVAGLRLADVARAAGRATV